MFAHLNPHSSDFGDIVHYIPLACTEALPIDPYNGDTFLCQLCVHKDTPAGPSRPLRMCKEVSQSPSASPARVLQEEDESRKQQLLANRLQERQHQLSDLRDREARALARLKQLSADADF